MYKILESVYFLLLVSSGNVGKLQGQIVTLNPFHYCPSLSTKDLYIWLDFIPCRLQCSMTHWVDSACWQIMIQIDCFWKAITRYSFCGYRAVVTFGLNALYGRKKPCKDPNDTLWTGAWGSTNAYQFIEYTISKGYKVDSWEFGN